MNADSRPAVWSDPPASLILCPQEVHVWRAHLDITPQTLGRFYLLLSEEERVRTDRFCFPKHRNRFIASHGALREILSRYLSIDSQEIAYRNNDYGKPYLANSPIEFNLSHSHLMALIAVAERRRIGVDVEWMRENIEYESIARRFFSPQEAANIKSIPSFFHCWTRKEAYIKAQGMGLSIPLDSFEVSTDPNDEEVRLTIHDPANERERWTIKTIDVKEGYAAAAAVEDETGVFHFWEWRTM
ncbi:MAG: 4'-phosphopantetheinyl transferase superfamily protein [Candidatus Omnitrophota bacterium]